MSEMNEVMTPEEEQFLKEIADEAADAADSDDAKDADDLQGEMVSDDLIRMIGELEEKLRAAESEKETRERELRCLSLLGEAMLPAELMPAVILSEDMEEAVALISRTVKTLVEEEVSLRCRSETPAVGTRAPISREELMRLPVAQIQRMRNSGAVLG